MKPKHRHSPRDGVNRLLRARPGETGFCVTVTGGIASTGLAPATRVSGPHAFAVRICVARHATHPSIAFHPAFVAIAIRPSWDGTRRIWILIWGPVKQKFSKTEYSEWKNIARI